MIDLIRWLTRALQFSMLMILSGRVFASGIPSATMFLSWIPILVYLICAVIWVLKFKKLSIVKRSLLVVLLFPVFFMSAMMIPLLIAEQNKYIDVIEILSAVVLTIMVISIFLGSITIANTRK